MWTVQRDSGYLDPPAISHTASGAAVAVYAQGRLGAQSSLVAVDLVTQQPLWRFPAQGGLSQPLRGAPAIDGGVVYVGGRDGFVYALDLNDGHLRWKFQAGGDVAAAIAVDGEKVFAVAQELKTASTTLYAIDASTGKQVWSTGTRGLAPIVTSPTVADGVLFVGAGNGTLRAYAADTGRVMWSTSLRGVFLAEPSLARTDDALYVMAATGAVYRIDPATGERVWDYQFHPTSVRGAPVLVGNFIVLGLDDGTVAAIDVRTGNLAWETRLAHRTFGPFAPAGDVLVASTVGVDGGSGGLVGFRHIAGPLTSVESPTKLHLGTALANAAVGGVAVVAAFLLLFRAILRRTGSAISVGSLDRAGASDG
jgi:outer membrane protein assembly factor BamB